MLTVAIWVSMMLRMLMRMRRTTTTMYFSRTFLARLICRLLATFWTLQLASCLFLN